MDQCPPVPKSSSFSAQRRQVHHMDGPLPSVSSSLSPQGGVRTGIQRGENHLQWVGPGDGGGTPREGSELDATNLLQTRQVDCR